VQERGARARGDAHCLPFLVAPRQHDVNHSPAYTHRQVQTAVIRVPAPASMGSLIRECALENQAAAASKTVTTATATTTHRSRQQPSEDLGLGAPRRTAAAPTRDLSRCARAGDGSPTSCATCAGGFSIWRSAASPADA
jgi:hypothetical protein